MKVSVSELMRLRKEVSSVISEANYMFNACTYGDTYVDGVDITNKSVATFEKMSNSITDLLYISLLINDTIEQFNCDNRIGSLVRAKANNLMKIRLMENALKNSQQTEKTSFIVVGSERKEVVTKFIPYVGKSTLKEVIKTVKKEMRDIQNKIDIANATVIDINLNYDDIEELISQFKG